MAGFAVIPAIDLKGERCVRLRQGLASEETVYSDDPVQMAEHWEAQGAARLHVVDLDGAFQGRPVHTALIRRIVSAVSIPVQVGGGLRTDDQIRTLIDYGVSRVILGTRACQAAEDMARLVDLFQENLAVGIDARDGQVQIKGWTETAPVDFVALATRVERMGVRTLICTDTASDGMLRGPNVPGIRAVCDHVDCDVVASGGIASVEHISALRNLGKTNLVGAIVGKALYEGTVTLKELQSAVK